MPTHLSNTSVGEQLSEGSGRALPLCVAGQEFTLFEQSTPLIESMASDIREAKSRVWLESYIFANDLAGQSIAAALIDRAAAGLDVRLIVDAVGSFSTPSAFFRSLRDAGVQVHIYHALSALLWRNSFFQRMNRRDHRKLLVIDDEVAYFGGMNIVDQSGIDNVQDAKARSLPSSAGWRDVHVRMVGDRQREVASAYERLWRRVHQKRFTSWPAWDVTGTIGAPEEAISFFDCWPSRKKRRAERVLVPLIRQARHDLTVSMAYFIPVGRVLRELIKARRRGVRVRVIIPGQSDVRAVQYATRHFSTRLLKRGIRIYERKQHMLHSKVMVVDGRWTVVGSCNLDPRSLRLNLEFMAVINARTFAAAVLQICEYEMQHSKRVGASDCAARTWWEKWAGKIAWSLRRWL